MNERQIELPLPNDSTEPAIVGNTVLPAVASEKLHRKLVEAAYRWVLKNSSCGVAFKELNTNACNGEYPDVIGFGAWIVFVCKGMILEMWVANAFMWIGVLGGRIKNFA